MSLARCRLTGLASGGTFDQEIQEDFKLKAMKTIKLLSTVLIASLSLSAFADGNPVGKSRTAKKLNANLVNSPAFEWGNPEDVNAISVESLKYIPYFIAAPEAVWGNPEDVNTLSVEKLKNVPLVAAPEFVWGNPDDLDRAAVENLKNAPLFASPAQEWGNPEDLDLVAIEKLKNAALIPSPSMVWGNPDDVNAGTVELLKENSDCAVLCQR